MKRLQDEKEVKEGKKRKRATARAMNHGRKVIEDEKWDRAKARHEIRLQRWRREYDGLHKGGARVPKPRRRLKAEVIEGESSICELSEDRSEDNSTELPSSGSSEGRGDDD